VVVGGVVVVVGVVVPAGYVAMRLPSVMVISVSAPVLAPGIWLLSPVRLAT
jgi:hypothetical protein